LCGILTYYSKNYLSNKIINSCLDSLSSISHRGPDGEGVVLINTLTGDYKSLMTNQTPMGVNTQSNFSNQDCKFNLLIGHRRLSIIDLTVNGHQPMFFNNNWITFNGEIYNYIEIKNELKTNGYKFNSETDTEVILKAFDYWGENCLNKFNGMWSIIIWDNKNKSLFVSNDRFGVKPLYFLKTNNDLVFTSEIKQFKSFTNLNLTINNKNKAVYLNHGISPLDNTTYFNEISRFPKSSFSKINFESDLDFSCISYFSLLNNKKKFPTNFRDSSKELSYLIYDSIKIRNRADVDLGISISGGIDSTIILQYYNDILRDNNITKEIPTFSAISPGLDGDESKYIYELKNHFPILSNYINTNEEFELNDFHNFLNFIEFPPKTMSFYAQWLVSKNMKSKGVTINLVGQGADEIFGGYHTHFFRYLRFLILKGRILKYLSELNAYSKLKSIKVNILHKIVINDLFLLGAYKLGLKKVDNKLLNSRYKMSDITEFLKNDLLVYELPFFLHSDDRSSMAHSVETRHPFLDFRIVGFGYSISEDFNYKNGWSKYILRSLLLDKLDNIKWRKDKKGYTVPDLILKSKFINSSDNTQNEFRKKCFNVIFDLN
tara:strand:+ start:12861 stop:14669 length:1809 start_codon:yes stop_codon:yes gene_type:complete